MLKKEYSLKTKNSFGIDVTAKEYLTINSESELLDLIGSDVLNDSELMILGGGSNVLFTRDYKGLILHPEMTDIKLIQDNGNEVIIECGAGMEWDSFVKYCVGKNLGGLENLSYIPGSVGASPIQNIGAYGVEVKDSIESVRAINLESGDVRIFLNSECEFDYRSSIFKTRLKNKYMVMSVVFRLNYDPSDFILNYGMVEERVSAKKAKNLETIRETIIEIRKEKLPEPDEIGNAGSFFKNPLIGPDHYSDLKNNYPELPSYNTGTEYIKIPAGWLIEKAGWKGKRKGDAGVHINQALVLVNYGNASGTEIYNLSEEILKSVQAKFGIELEREINIF
jgi:UDP-N-acetylmuramate dehydrogenase